MRTDIKYMARVGEVGIGRIQKRVLRELRRSNSELTIREIAERVHRVQLEKFCDSCGRGYPLTESQLVTVRQAVKALFLRGALREPRIEE